MVKCVIFGCSSGYKSNPSKVHQFGAPKDRELREKWQKCIPRKNFLLNDNSYVCENHFKEEDIIKYKESGNVKIFYKKWKLKEGAIPSLFPGPKYLSNTKKRRKLPFDRSSSSSDINLSTSSKMNMLVNGLDEAINLCPTQPEILPVIEGKLFTKLSTDIKLCGKWKKIVGNNELCFVIINTNPVPIIEKSIKVNVQDETSFAINGKIVQIVDLGITYNNTFDQFINCLNEFESIKLCHGGPKIELFPNASKSSYIISTDGRFQDKQCRFFIEKSSKSTCCIKCKQLKNILTCREKRRSINCKEMLIVSPSKKPKINELRKRAYALKRTVVRSQKQIVDLQEELNQAQQNMAKCNDNILQDQLKGMNESQRTLVLECFAASKVKNPKSRRYSENWLMLCLLFNIRSPSAYKYLRESALMPLPHPKTVRHYLSSIKTTCGFDPDFLQLLQKKIEGITERNRHGVLLFDSINLRKSLAVNSSNLTYSGLEDYGGETDKKVDQKEYADHALVFMFQSLGSNFSQTIGCFASKGEVKGVTIAQLILKAILLLENIGFYVDGIVCDGASTNRRMWKELGVDGSINNLKNYFDHPGSHDRKVFVFSDFVHLFKCVRNRLHNNKFLRIQPDLNQIAWAYLIEVYKEDIKHPGNLRLIPRITPQHLYLTPMAKMRVRLCTQVFSNSMAKAMHYYKTKGNLMLKGSEETSKFIEFWNNLFDNFNRNLPWQGLKLNDCEGFDGFKNALEYIDSWEKQMLNGNIGQEEFLTTQTVQGLRVTLKSTVDLSKYLLESCDYDYVLTGKMCQDPLEKFFGIIRQSSGPNDHPTTPTFLHLYKILSVYSVMKPPKHGNCSVLESDAPKISLSDLKEIFHDKTSERSDKIYKLKTKLDQLINEGLWEPCQILPQVSNNIESSTMDCILYYVCGIHEFNLTYSLL